MVTEDRKLYEETLRNKVVDAANGSPIDGATVSVLGTPQGTVSASDGSFLLANIQDGEYTLHVSYLGYVEARLAGGGSGRRLCFDGRN